MQLSDLKENIDDTEIKHFSSLAATWWDKAGPMKMLHAVNPIRMAFILDCVDLTDRNVLDIGCGAGILTQALASHRAARVTGIDVAADLIEAAQAHQQTLTTTESNIACKPTFIHAQAESFAQTHLEAFDIITCLECLEHVPDPLAILAACQQMLKPGGLLFLSTLNRTFKSYLHAIIGAEYLLNMIPRGTHHYDKFIRPHELDRWARAHGFYVQKLKGLQYHPITKHFTFSQDLSVNYIACYQKQSGLQNA